MTHTQTAWKSPNDGLRLFAQSWAPDGDYPGVLCLVHGLGEHSGRYAHLAKYLNSAGYAVLSYDLRGHGKSEGKRGYIPSYEALMDDVAALIQHARELFPAKAYFLYGHSLGGNQVINFTLRHKPDLAGVIASAPALRLAFEPSAGKLALGKLMYRLAPGFIMANDLDVNGLSHDAAVINAYQQDPLVHDRVSARLGLDLINSGMWALHHAGEFSLPLLLMHGSEDPLTSVSASRQFAEQTGKGCTFKAWDGLYHEIHNEPEQEQVFRLVVDWMNERRRTAGQINPIMAKSALTST